MAATAGTLAPPLLKSSSSMDLVFTTHWVPPTEVPIVTEKNAKCIEKKLEQMGEQEKQFSRI